MSSLYERDPSVPPLHIRHVGKSHQPHLPPEQGTEPADLEQRAIVPNVADNVSYQELVVFAALDLPSGASETWADPNSEEDSLRNDEAS